MEALEARGRALGEAGAAKAVARLAERAGEVPGVRVEVATDGVVLTGRGLWRRPELRWIGGMLR